MKRTALASLGIALGFATLAHPALAQSTSGPPADFGPPPPSAMQDPALASPSSSDAQEPSAPVTAQPAPAVIEEAPAPTLIDEVPAAQFADDADAYATTRRAAPDPAPRRDPRDANPQTGHYLGHGLFNNWGQNDFGA